MAAEHLGDMTRSELRTLVEEIVEEHLRSRTHAHRPEDKDRPLVEVLEGVQELIIIPPLGTPSVVELLREDRDR